MTLTISLAEKKLLQEALVLLQEKAIETLTTEAKKGGSQVTASALAVTDVVNLKRKVDNVSEDYYRDR